MLIRSAVDVVVSVHQVSSLEQLVQVYQGSDHDKAAENIPQPEGTATKVVVNAASFQLTTDTVADLVVPYDCGDAEGNGGDEEDQQAVVHGLFAVVSGCNGVDIVGNGGHNYQPVDAEGDQGEKNGLNNAFVGFQLACGSGAYCVFNNKTSFLSSSNRSCKYEKTVNLYFQYSTVLLRCQYIISCMSHPQGVRKSNFLWVTALREECVVTLQGLQAWRQIPLHPPASGAHCQLCTGDCQRLHNRAWCRSYRTLPWEPLPH